MIGLAAAGLALAALAVVKCWLDERAYKRWIVERRIAHERLLDERDDEIAAYLRVHER